jgi:hypothetical protein
VAREENRRIIRLKRDSSELFPPTDCFGPDQSRPASLRLAAHVKRIAVGEIFRDVSIVGQRYVGAGPSETHSISVILEQMWMKPNSGVLATTYDTEQHLCSSGKTAPPSLSAIQLIEAIGQHCGILRIISVVLETVKLCDRPGRSKCFRNLGSSRLFLISRPEFSRFRPVSSRHCALRKWRRSWLALRSPLRDARPKLQFDRCR